MGEVGGSSTSSGEQRIQAFQFSVDLGGWAGEPREVEGESAIEALGLWEQDRLKELAYSGAMVGTGTYQLACGCTFMLSRDVEDEALPTIAERMTRPCRDHAREMGRSTGVFIAWPLRFTVTLFAPSTTGLEAATARVLPQATEWAQHSGYERGRWLEENKPSALRRFAEGLGFGHVLA